jgi:hypothetical protein
MITRLCSTLRPVALLLTVISSTGAAQGMVSGTVRDSASGVPLADALIDLRDGTDVRARRSGEDGAFRFEGVPAGAHELRIRRFGYLEAIARLTTNGRDTTVSVVLARRVQLLDTVRAAVHGPGVYGAVASSSDLAPLANARVQVLGADRAAEGDSAGRFFIEVKRPGSYLLRVDHVGYTRRLISIDIPSGQPVEAIALLDPAKDPTERPVEKFYREFDQRVQFMNANGALITGAALRKTGATALSDAVNDTPVGPRHGLRIGSSTCVFVNGMPRPGWSIDQFPLDQVDAIELYTKTGDATGSIGRLWPSNTRCTASLRMGSGQPGATYAVIWLRE